MPRTCTRVHPASYPHNWRKVRRTLKRVVGHCEMCGVTQDLTVHHRGIPFANGRANHPSNKRDLRRENLAVLCRGCHDWVEPAPRRNRSLRAKKHAWKRTALEHRGIGTGLTLYHPDFGRKDCII